MGAFGGFYKGDKKKLSKRELEKKAKKVVFQKPTSFALPVIVGMKKGE